MKTNFESSGLNHVNNEWQNRVVALTGTIGSGKSTASKILSSLGATIVNADDLAREVVSPGSPAFQEIATYFGPSVVNPDKTLNRKKLGEIIFSDTEKRKHLENIIHPKIRELAKAYCTASLDNNNLTIYEIPLLFESGMKTSEFRETVLIKASDEVCLERIIQRDNLTIDEAKKRIAAQIPTAEKEKLASIAIDNSGTIEELASKLKRLYDKLTQPAPETK